MSRNVRDLRDAGLYLVAICLLFTALAGGISVATRAAPGVFAAAVEPMFESEAGLTRLSVMTETARSIRAALDQPIPPPSPLPPITAELAFGHLKDGKRPAVAAAPTKRRLPAEAMDAMASAGPAYAGSPPGWSAGAPTSLLDKHRVY